MMVIFLKLIDIITNSCGTQAVNVVKMISFLLIRNIHKFEYHLSESSTFAKPNLVGYIDNTIMNVKMKIKGKNTFFGISVAI